MTTSKRRRIWSIEGNSQRLDGGAMFGNAPKALWQRWIAPDEQNRIPLACRAALIEEPDGRLILLETGIGAFFPPKLRDRYGVQEAEHALLKNLGVAGFSKEAIDVVVLSHLHFDHAGGLLEAYDGGEARLVFPEATYVVSVGALERARAPHFRDRASFIPELPGLLESSGRLEVVEGDRSEALGPDYRLHRSQGHTPGLMMTEIPSDDGPILFCADLIPGAPWVHLPITMGYDRYPERLIDEKRERLDDLFERRGRLFFTHDPSCAVGRVTRSDRGRFGVEEKAERLVGFEL